MKLQVTTRIHTSAAAVALLLFAGSGPGAENPAAHVRHFAEVNSHLFRGGQPSAVGIQELGAMGVKLVIDLRGSDEARDAERDEVEKLGIHYKNIPFSAFGAPSKQQMEQVLALLLHNESDPVFVHCLRGKDRTGTVIACYRIQHDHWDNRKALVEAKEHGLSMAERGMRSYILHFTPLTLPELLLKPAN